MHCIMLLSQFFYVRDAMNDWKIDGFTFSMIVVVGIVFLICYIIYLFKRPKKLGPR